MSYLRLFAFQLANIFLSSSLLNSSVFFFSPQASQLTLCFSGVLYYFLSFFLLTFQFYLIYYFIQEVLISHQFYTHQCIHVNPNCPIHHTTTPTAPRNSPLAVHSFVLCLNFCPANRFICTIFLGSTYMRQYTIFLFLFLTYFTLYNSLQIHPHPNE